MAREYIVGIERATTKTNASYYRVSQVDIDKIIKETGAVEVQMETGSLTNQSEMLKFKPASQKARHMDIELYKNEKGYESVTVPLWSSKFRQGTYNGMSFNLMDLKEKVGATPSLSIFFNTNKKSEKSPDIRVVFSKPLARGKAQAQGNQQQAAAAATEDESPF